MFWTVTNLSQGSPIWASNTNHPSVLRIIHIGEEWYLKLRPVSIEKQKRCWIFVMSWEYSSVIDDLENVSKNHWSYASFGRTGDIIRKVDSSGGTSWTTWEVLPWSVVLLFVHCEVIRAFYKDTNAKLFLHWDCLWYKYNFTEYWIPITCCEPESGPAVGSWHTYTPRFYYDQIGFLSLIPVDDWSIHKILPSNHFLVASQDFSWITSLDIGLSVPWWWHFKDFLSYLLQIHFGDHPYFDNSKTQMFSLFICTVLNVFQHIYRIKYRCYNKYKYYCISCVQVYVHTVWRA